MRRNENCVLVFSTRAPHSNPLPAHGERASISTGTANPGFRVRSTLGYKYLAPSGACSKQFLAPRCLLLSGASVACGDRDIKGDSPAP